LAGGNKRQKVDSRGNSAGGGKHNISLFTTNNTKKRWGKAAAKEAARAKLKSGEWQYEANEATAATNNKKKNAKLTLKRKDSVSDDDQEDEID
jgi:hypothetical protein